MIRWGDYVVAPYEDGWVWGQTEGNEFPGEWSGWENVGNIVGIEVDGCTASSLDDEWHGATKLWVEASTVTKV
jgi:hypothetical protein